jgi:hypothetical protein
MRAEVTFGIRPDSEFLVAALYRTCECYGAQDVSAFLCKVTVLYLRLAPEWTFM